MDDCVVDPEEEEEESDGTPGLPTEDEDSDKEPTEKDFGDSESGACAVDYLVTQPLLPNSRPHACFGTPSPP
jgi:hypothetical protein